jgi:hypothetical protein
MALVREMGFSYLARIAFILALASFANISDAKSGSKKAPVLKEIGAFNTGGIVKSVTIDDDYAYISDMYRGLYIVDISDPANLKHVMSMDSAGFGPAAKTGDFLFTCTHNFFQSVFNINDPYKPLLVSQVKLKNYPIKMHINSNYAYIANQNDGIQIFDISHITDPVRLGGFKAPGSVGDMAINNCYAYLADGHTKEDTVKFSGGFYIVDISKPRNMRLAGRYDIGAHVQGICLSDRYCYLAAGDSGIYIMDVKKPDKPKVVCRVMTPNYAFNVRVYGDIMYAIQGGEGLGVYDIKNIKNIQLLTEFKVNGLVVDAVKAGNYLYLAAGKAGMVIVESK